MKQDNILQALKIGTVLQGNDARYRIVKHLGQGTFGITYLAEILSEDGSASNMLVCIKEFFMRDFNGRVGDNVRCTSEKGIFESYRRKFKREARNLSSLRDENIVRIVESFEGNNTVYYAMSFIHGGSLDELIAAKGRLSEKEALKIACVACRALEKIHVEGMVHLDLKPRNIMMMSGKVPVLIDFGLSKHFTPDGQPESSTTIGAGTPGYAPMEQMNYRGQESNLDPMLMDVYALGGTLFKMLTGERPPNAPDIFNDGFPVYDLRKLKISEATEKLVAKAMAPSQADRFKSAKELEEAILDSYEKLKNDNNPGNEEVKKDSKTAQQNINQEKSGNVSVEIISAEPSDPGILRGNASAGGNGLPPTNQPKRGDSYSGNGFNHNDEPQFEPPRKNHSIILVAIIMVVVAAIVYFAINAWRGAHGMPLEIEDTTMMADTLAEAQPVDSLAIPDASHPDKNYRLVEMTSDGAPSYLTLTKSGSRMKGNWHRREADVRMSGTFANGQLELKARSTSMRLVLRDNGDGTLDGTIIGPGTIEQAVTFRWE